MDSSCSPQNKPANESSPVMELYRFVQTCCVSSGLRQGFNALEAVRHIKHIMGSLIKMLMHSSRVGQLAQEQAGQTPSGSDTRCWEACASVLTWQERLRGG